MNKKVREALYTVNITAIHASLSPILSREEAPIEAHERAVAFVLMHEERLKDLHHRCELAARSEKDAAYATRGLLFTDKDKRWRKFWITEEELTMLNEAEGATRDELVAVVFAGYGCRVEGARVNPYDQREITALVADEA